MADLAIDKQKITIWNCVSWMLSWNPRMVVLRFTAIFAYCFTLARGIFMRNTITIGLHARIGINDASLYEIIINIRACQGWIAVLSLHTMLFDILSLALGMFNGSVFRKNWNWSKLTSFCLPIYITVEN